MYDHFLIRLRTYGEITRRKRNFTMYEIPIHWLCSFSFFFFSSHVELHATLDPTPFGFRQSRRKEVWRITRARRRFSGTGNRKPPLCDLIRPRDKHKPYCISISDHGDLTNPTIYYSPRALRVIEKNKIRLRYSVTRLFTFHVYRS